MGDTDYCTVFAVYIPFAGLTSLITLFTHAPIMNRILCCLLSIFTSIFLQFSGGGYSRIFGTVFSFSTIVLCMVGYEIEVGLVVLWILDIVFYMFASLITYNNKPKRELEDGELP